MAIERTFSIVKPDAVSKNLIGAIYSRFESAGLKVVASKMLHMSSEQAAGFYAEHQGKPFYDNLVSFMTSGPVMVQVLEGEDAIRRNREIMGATNPKRRWLVPCVPVMPRASIATQCMALMHLHPLPAKLPTSSLTTRSVRAADFCGC